ncbi:MAG TPA: redoxin domain-containing protein [Opitutaceae bacterium]|nr:redoxin domain-containing protein [Opitutaceae bacterium]
MKSLAKLLIGAATLAALVSGLSAAQVGEAAPDFTLTDIHGQTHSLSSFKGKTVVLEWVNPECPIVMKHYDKSGNIPKLQQEAKASGIVWLQINSGHQGAQGDYDPNDVKGWMNKNKVVSTAYFRDQDGKVGKMYDARTTPHMYIVDPKGTLVYAGGIDSIQSGNPADIAKATNYVREALMDLKDGKPIRTATSRPYGCNVKYK